MLKLGRLELIVLTQYSSSHWLSIFTLISRVLNPAEFKITLQRYYMKPAVNSFLQQNLKTVRDIPDLHFCKYSKKSIPVFEPMCLEPGGGFNKLDHCGIVYNNRKRKLFRVSRTTNCCWSKLETRKESQYHKVDKHYV